MRSLKVIVLVFILIFLTSCAHFENGKIRTEVGLSATIEMKFEGIVIKIEKNIVTLNNGSKIKIENSSIAEISVGSYVKGITSKEGISKIEKNN